MRDVVVVLTAFVVAGALCGLLWYAWWQPAPTGVVLGGYPYFDEDAEFRATGMYAVIAAPTGILLGVLASWRRRSDARVTVVAVLLGALAASAVMALVGHLLGPESALGLAEKAADLDEVRADLRVAPAVAWLIFPVGAMLGTLTQLLSAVEPAEEAGTEPSPAD